MDTSRRIGFQGAGVEISNNTLRDDINIRIERLEEQDLPPLLPGMINVTAEGGGYRFLPAGKSFDKSVRVYLLLDKSLFDEEGNLLSAAHTYYWDEKHTQWLSLTRVHVDHEKSLLVSETKHFTTMINAVLTAPRIRMRSGLCGII